MNDNGLNSSYYTEKVDKTCTNSVKNAMIALQHKVGEFNKEIDILKQENENLIKKLESLSQNIIPDLQTENENLKQVIDQYKNLCSNMDEENAKTKENENRLQTNIIELQRTINEFELEKKNLLNRMHAISSELYLANRNNDIIEREKTRHLEQNLVDREGLSNEIKQILTENKDIHEKNNTQQVELFELAQILQKVNYKHCNFNSI